MDIQEDADDRHLWHQKLLKVNYYNEWIKNERDTVFVRWIRRNSKRYVPWRFEKTVPKKPKKQEEERQKIGSDIITAGHELEIMCDET